MPSTKNRRLLQRRYNHDNNNNGYWSYRSNDATADTLESDDTIIEIPPDDDQEPTADAVDNVIEIEGLELLKIEDELAICHHHRMDIDDIDIDDFKNGESPYDNYEEEDSLILTRQRLSHTWNPPPVRVLTTQDSLELARKRLSNHQSTTSTSRGRGRSRRVRPITRDVEERLLINTAEEEEEEQEEDSDYDEEEEDLESVSLSQVSLYDDDEEESLSSFDCSATVDSLELTRKRFAARRANRREGRSMRRHDGSDIIYLIPRPDHHHKKSSKNNRHRHNKNNPKQPCPGRSPGRIHSSRHHPKTRTIIHSLSPSPRQATLRHHNSGSRVVRAALQHLN